MLVKGIKAIKEYSDSVLVRSCLAISPTESLKQNIDRIDFNV